MPSTKKSTGAAATPKKSNSTQLPYKDMIRESIVQLKERNGVSRQALKKYIQANFHPTLTGAQFDVAFNKALKTGVEKGDFTQPKGPSGPVKLAKKAAPEKKAKPAAASGEAKKAATTGATATGTKKTATKAKAATTKKPAAKTASTAAKPKKTTTTTATAKKANTGTKRKAPSSAPAVVEQKTVLNKTKSGRVSKGKEPTPGSTSAKRSAAGKKGAAKSPATKKATPAKAEA